MVAPALQGPSRLEQTQTAFQGALLNGELKARRQMAYHYQVAAKSLMSKWQLAYARLQAAKAAGADDTYLSGFIWSEQRLAKLLTSAIDVWQGCGTGVAGVISQEMQQAGQLARQGVIDTMQQELAGAIATRPSSVTVDFAGFPDTEIQTLAARMSDGSPITEAIAKRFGSSIVPMMKDQLIAAMANGENPAQLARRLAAATGAHAGHMAVLMRTEMLRVYRDTSLGTMQANRKYIRGWVWVSALAETTCPMCWAMHGSEHTLDERMETHPCCRCYMKALLRPPGEINPLLAGADLETPKVAQGGDLFRRLPDESQRRIMGPKLYGAYKDGRISLSQLPARTWSPTWGGGRRQRTTAELLGGGKPKPPAAPKGGGPKKPPAPAPAPKPKPPTPTGPTGPIVVAPPTKGKVPLPEPVATTGPGKPKGPAMSKVIDTSGLPKSGKNIEGFVNPIKETLAHIDAVHGDGSMTGVPITLDQSTTHYGVYKSFPAFRGFDPVKGELTLTRPAHPSSVQISARAGIRNHVRLTTAHELGHYIDQQQFGKENGVPVRFGTDGAVSLKQQKWLAAVKKSQAYATLNAQLDAAKTTGKWQRADGSTTTLDRGHLRYVLGPDELWARSYAQYIASRSKNPAFLAELDAERDPVRNTYHAKQWQDDDFQPIADAFDELFRAEGWLE